MSALAATVRELELHAAQAGWDQPAQLFALVDTAELRDREPALAEAIGLAPDSTGLTPVEQDALAPDREIEQVLPGIVWPADVVGCAAVVERLVLPPDAEQELPSAAADAAAYAAGHPQRQEVRIVAAATRGGERYCALRLRAYDSDDAVMAAPDLVPELLDLVAATLEESDAAPGDAS